MNDTVIITDSCADLPKSYIEKYNVDIIPMYYRFKEEVYEDNTEQSSIFYNRLRNGELANTLCSDLSIIEDTFKKNIEKYNNIIYICFSSTLSSSYSNSVFIKDELIEKYPDKNIYVLDSLTGSFAQGLMVITANELIKSDKDYNYIVKYLEDNKKYYNSEFIVNDLKHLKRGGRLNTTSAFIGGVLDIKPFVHTDECGNVSVAAKFRGKKNALKSLANRLIERADFNYPIGIVNADNLIDAQELKNKIEELKEIKELIITSLSPAIGSHLGADSLGITYVKKKK